MKVLRRLQGVTHWVVDEPREIRRLVNASIRREWESDILDQSEDHEHGIWLGSLSRRKWQLKIVELNGIKLGDEIMSYRNEKTGYNFKGHLRERKRPWNVKLTSLGRCSGRWF